MDGFYGFFTEGDRLADQVEFVFFKYNISMF